MVLRKFKEIMADSFPNLEKDINLQNWKAKRTPSRKETKDIYAETQYLTKAKRKP